jgi:hypothetical protein
MFVPKSLDDIDANANSGQAVPSKLEASKTHPIRDMAKAFLQVLCHLPTGSLI